MGGRDKEDLEEGRSGMALGPSGEKETIAHASAALQTSAVIKVSKKSQAPLEQGELADTKKGSQVGTDQFITFLKEVLQTCGESGNGGLLDS